MLFRLIAFFLLLFAGNLAPAFASGSVSADEPVAVDLAQEPNAEAATSGSSADSQRYGVQITASNTRLQIRVNDVPMAFKIFRESETADFTFNEWLKRGLNIVEVQMDRFSDGHPYRATYNIYFQSPTQIVSGERKTLYASPEQTVLPLRQPIGIRATSVPTMRIWQTEKLNFTPEERERLVGALNSLRTRMIDAMTKGDNAFLASFDKPIRDEVEKAYGRIPGGEEETMKRRMEIAEKLRKMVNASVVSNSPEIIPEDMNFEVIGNGHLVRITRLDGTPVIHVSRGDLDVTITKPIYGTIGGLWDMLRN